MDRKARSLAADLAALLVVFIWGVNFVFVKGALAQFNVSSFVLVRYAAMLALGWAVVAARSTAGAEVQAILRDRRQVLLVEHEAAAKHAA